MKEQNIEEVNGNNVGEKPSLLGIITSPGEQFERIKERPIIWGAMGIIIVLFILGTYLTSTGVELPPELQGLEMDEDLAAGMGIISIISAVFMGIFIPLFTVLISTLIYLLIAKIAQSNVRFKQLFSMNTYILFISGIGALLNGAFHAIFGTINGELFTSLGSIIEVTGPMQGLFNSLEVFSIWGVFLAAIGLQKVANFSKGLAWGISIGFFILGVIFAMISTGMAGMIGV